MWKKTAFYSGLCAAALSLGACSWLQQPAAPVETGSTSGTADNPYGTAPYTPPSSGTAASSGSYTPPVSSSSGSFVPNYSPVDVNAATHTVQKGDTVYNISKRYGISQDNLKIWNNLADNNIGVGQVLKVKPAGYRPPAGGTATVTPPVVVTTTTNSTSSTAGANTVSSAGTRTAGGIVWQKPTQGSVLQGFGGSSKGIDFGGSLGQAVVSAADGKVVYAGSGLRGYGNLVIVQHNQTYLTAYGHNQKLLVKEGQTVKRGQQIATMGNSDASRTQLHFELRENGNPVNPNTYLPN